MNSRPRDTSHIATATRRALAFALVPALLATLFAMTGPLYAAEDAGIRSVFAHGAGNRALAMGSAFGAIADDPSAPIWNPGGLGWLERPSFYATHTDLIGMGFGEQFGSIVLPSWRLGVFSLTVRHFGVDGIEGRPVPGQAFVRVMRGCNNFCTYCIVPYVRGPEISRPPQAIIEQIRKLTDRGVKQITLLGQTIDAYKYEAGDKTYALADLLEMTSDIEAVKWVRFITSHPGKFDPAILHAMGDLPKVCSYLHIPAQSGSDRILKAMNRGYTSAQYLDLIAQARDIVPGISIASDFIVGFPNETDEDFAATVDLVKKARFKNSFVFKYSPRPGTHSTKKMEDNVSDEIKKQRNIELLDVQNRIAEEDNKSFAGQTLEVLVEGLSKKPHLNKAENDNNPQLVGRTATDYIVVFNGPESLTGGFAKVKIDKTSPLTLFGQLDHI